MPKVKAPLFGLDASGQLGKAIVFSKWKKINYVRAYTIPHNPQTALQQAWRAKLKELAAKWNSVSLHSCLRQCHNNEAYWWRLPMSGYNLFIHNYLMNDDKSWIYLSELEAINRTEEEINYIDVSAISDAKSASHIIEIYNVYKNLYKVYTAESDEDGKINESYNVTEWGDIEEPTYHIKIKIDDPAKYLSSGAVFCSFMPD